MWGKLFCTLFYIKLERAGYLIGLSAETEASQKIRAQKEGGFGGGEMFVSIDGIAQFLLNSRRDGQHEVGWGSAC